MKKLSIAITILAAAVVLAAPLSHSKIPVNTSQRIVPSTIQADFPVGPCPPDCPHATSIQAPSTIHNDFPVGPCPPDCALTAANKHPN